MKKWNVLLALIWLLIVTLFVTQSALAKEESMSMANASLSRPSNETELISFVNSAVVHVKEVGKERAIKDFLDINGSWVRSDVYIFAHAFNGTTLVLPYLPNAVGTNRLDVQDAEGRYINREMNCIALHGSGSYRYVYHNPIDNKTQEKISYVSKVDDNWWLGAGIYYNNSTLGGSNMITVSIITRRLRDGKTYEDFRKAWYHTIGFGTSSRLYTMINVLDPREIIVMGFIDTERDQLLSTAGIDVSQRLANPLDEVIEPEIGRKYGILVSEDDFSAAGKIAYKPPSVAGRETNFEEVSRDLLEFKNVVTQASEERDRAKKDN